MLVSTVIETPWAPLTVLALDGVVVQSWFGRAPLVDVHAGASPRSVRTIAGITDAVRAWVRGELDAITRVPVRQSGSAFHQDVWSKMRLIPAGEPCTYGALAARAGRPRAARSVGTACATNAVAPFVPCHRVVRSNGVGEYGYGVDLKVALLAHESAADSIIDRSRGRR